MITEDIKKRLEDSSNLNDIDTCKITIALADEFIASLPNGANSAEELDLGIELVRRLVSLTYITSTKEFENDHRLYRDILQRKIKVFKICIPAESSKLRGITELLLGMKENELN